MEKKSKKVQPSEPEWHYFGGMSGSRLGVEKFDIGQGIVLSNTYAHVTAPFLIAFSKPEKPGLPHPAPWAAASGGFGFDISVQISLPRDVKLTGLNRISAVWWIVALLRLKTQATLVLPIVSNVPFSKEFALDKKSHFMPMEMSPRVISFPDERKKVIKKSDLEWLRDNWMSVEKAMQDDGRIYEAIFAYDFSRQSWSLDHAIMFMWGAIENLFLGVSQELRFRISGLVSGFLEPIGIRRNELRKKILKLYDMRSKVAHGSKLEKPEIIYRETRDLLRRCILRIIEKKKFPTKEELERNIFDNHLWT